MGKCLVKITTRVSVQLRFINHCCRAVRVRVRDVNEAPVFRENPRRVSVLEGTPPGTTVTTYTASDPDTRRLQTLT